MCFVKSLAYLMLAFQLLVANAASSKENEELRQFFKNNITLRWSLNLLLFGAWLLIAHYLNT